jgi:hypothetical protein
MQVGFYFDQTRCTGCSACRVACKDWNDIPAGPENWMNVHYSEKGKCPDMFQVVIRHYVTPGLPRGSSFFHFLQNIFHGAAKGTGRFQFERHQGCCKLQGS